MTNPKVYTYDQQPPNNEEPWRFGEACSKAAADPKCGDYIDRGLILLRELQAKGYGIVKLSDEPSVALCPHCGKSEPHTHRVPGVPEPVVFPSGSSPNR